MTLYDIEQPRHRSKTRRIIGREYYILRRKLKWLFGRQRFARQYPEVDFPISITRHRSLLLRPLKGVDMYLQYNKITNLKIAISHLHKCIIYPGETFSVWRRVGRPTARKGYLEGLVLQNGCVSKGIGGGLCQLGNLLYWLALHSPLTVTERWRHSYDVFPDVNRTIPFACGATLSFNHVDLQLKNETSAPLQILLWLDQTHLNGEIRALEPEKNKYEIYEKEHHIQHQWWGGYSRHNEIWQRKTNLLTLQETETLIARNSAIMMYDPFLEIPSAK